MAAAKRRVRELAKTHCHVETMGDDVDITILAVEVDPQFRMKLEKIEDERRHHVAAEGHGSAKAQRARQIALPSRDEQLRRLELPQQDLASLEIQRADLRHADAARIAVKQPHGEAPLQLRDMLGHGRLGKPKVLGGAREAARFDDTNENLKPGQPIQGGASWAGRALRDRTHMTGAFPRRSRTPFPVARRPRGELRLTTVLYLFYIYNVKFIKQIIRLGRKRNHSPQPFRRSAEIEWNKLTHVAFRLGWRDRISTFDIPPNCCQSQYCAQNYECNAQAPLLAQSPMVITCAATRPWGERDG